MCHAGVAGLHVQGQRHKNPGKIHLKEERSFLLRHAKVFLVLVFFFFFSKCLSLVLRYFVTFPHGRERSIN